MYCINQLEDKKHFVRAWTDHYITFGIRTLSPIEGRHAQIKSYWTGSRADLFEAVKSIEVYLEDQWTGVKEQLAKECKSQKLGPLYDEVSVLA